MKFRSIFMFVGCVLGGLISFVYWYSNNCISAQCEMGSNLFSVILYGVFIGLFCADFITQGISKKEA